MAAESAELHAQDVCRLSTHLGIAAPAAPGSRCGSAPADGYLDARPANQQTVQRPELSGATLGAVSVEGIDLGWRSKLCCLNLCCFKLCCFKLRGLKLGCLELGDLNLCLGGLRQHCDLLP